MEYKFTYLCPIRFADVDKQVIENFDQYWSKLAQLGAEVLVVDGSPRHVFQVHKKAWSNCKHIAVDPRYRFLNGKVNGLITGVLEASNEFIIMGDDDIRYDPEDIHRMLKGLEDHDLVKPQNYFSPSPFWTKIDTGRILLNRAFIPEGDFPGTLGFKKEVFLKAWPYDGDVLFDNEEIVKHLENRGGRILYDRDLFVRRKPPSFKKWLEQRPRQAYEDFVMQKRTVFFLALIPIFLILIGSKKVKTATLLGAILFLGALLKAEKGRSGAAEKYLSPKILIFAPLWILERSVSIYLALYWKLVKGGYPFGDRLIKKGTGRAWIEGKQQPIL